MAGNTALATPSRAAVPERLYRRNSAGGQALHRWQCTGKLTTIHIVYEMASNLELDTLVEKVDVKLLQRFPRWRGYPSADERSWCVPETVNARDYVQLVDLDAPSEADEAEALQRHVEQQMALPLPAKRSWTAHLIRYSGRSERCAVLWRVSHTVADGVVLSQIMSSVLCEPLSVDDEPPTMAGPPRPDLEARRPKRASVLERVWRILCGTLFVLALIFWPSDPHTCLQLGPFRWRDRTLRKRKVRADSASGEKSAADGAAADQVAEIAEEAPRHGGITRMAVGEAVDVPSLKAAAAAAGVTINDLLMTSVAAGIREYLQRKAADAETAAASVLKVAAGEGAAPPFEHPLEPCGAASRAEAAASPRVLPPADDLSLTAVAVINPRTTMPQDLNSSKLLDDYASMVGPGCDITLALLPLPCGVMEPAARLRALASQTRRLKLSPASHLLRLGANLIVRWLGLGVLIGLYTHVLAKFTTYVSNVVAPPVTGALCGVPIAQIWFGTTPLDFGVSFSFLSYAGRNRLTCVSDLECVPNPELMVTLVRAKLIELMHAALEQAETAPTVQTLPRNSWSFSYYCDYPAMGMHKVPSTDTMLDSLLMRGGGRGFGVRSGLSQRKNPTL